MTSFSPSPLVHSSPTFSALIGPPRIGNSTLPPAPDSEIAFWNKPCDAGEPINICTDPAPADSPKIVTLPASPPNAAMLRFTHCSAAI